MWGPKSEEKKKGKDMVFAASTTAAIGLYVALRLFGRLFFLSLGGLGTPYPRLEIFLQCGEKKERERERA